MADIAIQNLLEAGVHFGHQTRRWNPKMRKYIFTERNGIYIIDLHKTLALLNKACKVVSEIAAKGEPILFVGTKPQASSIMMEEANRSNQYHVVNRWAGGMLTNFRTIRQSIKRLDHLESMSTDGTYEHLTKKEVLTLEKQRERLMYVLEGIRNMNRLPGLLIIVDTKKEKIAVNEAQRLGIPICAIIDTNSDPDPITYPIPGNDDAIRSIKLLLSTLTESILEGMQKHVDEKGVAEKVEAIKETAKQEDEQRKGQRRPRGRSSRGKAEDRDTNTSSYNDKPNKHQQAERKRPRKPPRGSEKGRPNADSSRASSKMEPASRRHNQPRQELSIIYK